MRAKILLPAALIAACLALAGCYDQRGHPGHASDHPHRGHHHDDDHHRRH